MLVPFTSSRAGALGGPAAFGFTLIPQLFALGQGNLTLDLTVFKVHTRWHQGVAFLLGFGLKFAQFVGADKQFAGTERGLA